MQRNRSWRGWTLGLTLTVSMFTTSALAQEPARTVFGDWGFDLAGRDMEMAPGDDFFAHANGRYQAALVIPSDRASYSPRAANSMIIEQRLHAILEQARLSSDDAPSVTQKVGAFYASFMDEARVEALGWQPLAADLSAIRAARTAADLATLSGRASESFAASLFTVDVQPDAKQASRYAVHLGQGGLGLPDRDYYLDDRFAGERAKYQAYLATLLHLVRWPDADARARDVLAFETALARDSWSKVDQRDSSKIYNPMRVVDLEREAAGFPWRAFLKQAGLAQVNHVIVAERSAFPKLSRSFESTPIETLRAWAAVQMIDHAAPYLSADFVEAWFDLHGRALAGQVALPPRWQRGVRAVAGGEGTSTDRIEWFGNLGFAVGELYAARHFPPSDKVRVERLVDNLRQAFAARIRTLDWMEPETKAEALRKLTAYKVKIGYPDTPRDYHAVDIRRDDLIGNVLRAAAADWAFRSRRLNQPVDRDEWVMTPQMNNAYNGALLDIVFPAAILMPPVFDANADDAVNYGALGVVIGHELTHGFDDQGRKFDAQGRLRDWWAASDARRFEERAAKLGAQFSSYEPLPGLHVNGALTMGENIADLGGLNLALDAYRASLKGRPAPVIDGLTGEQRLFLGWAQIWRGKLREDALRRMIVSDPHAPRQYRVNGPVRNIDDWYRAFNVAPTQNLYLLPENRIRIW